MYSFATASSSRSSDSWRGVFCLERTHGRKKNRKKEKQEVKQQPQKLKKEQHVLLQSVTLNHCVRSLACIYSTSDSTAAIDS